MIFYSLRKGFFNKLFLVLFSLFSGGCIYLVVGGVGALGGYIVSPDTVEGLLTEEKGDVWNATLEVVSMMGAIKEKNETGGIIIAKTNGTKVTILIYNIGAQTVRISIKARKAFMPKIRVAQDIYVKVATKLQEE